MDNRFKQYEVLKWASLFLEKYDREPKVAELLLQHHLGIQRAEFFARMQEPIEHEQLLDFEENIINHALTGIPVQHVIGHETFFGREFKVNEHVLIPRPETEELVDRVLRHVRENNVNDAPLTIVDIGTGSGIIAITLALELKHARVCAVDISEQALQVAEENSERHLADVEFYKGDFLTPIIEQNIKADIIVSNPPYIALEEAEELSETVKNFDPSLALFAEEKGLGAYKKITRQLPSSIKRGGAASVYFEIGQSQGASVSQLLKKEFPQSTPVVYQDINQKDRIIHCKLK